MLCWWAYQPTCTTDCSQCSTLQRDPSSVYDAPTTSPTHSPFSTGWRSRSVFRLSLRQSSIVHWTVRLLATWLQIYAVCLICRPDDVWDRHLLTSSMSVSRSVQQLETELSSWLVLDYGTVCHITSSRVTHCHISVVDSKHFYCALILFRDVGAI